VSAKAGILSASRAQNVAISIARLPFKAPELAEILLQMDPEGILTLDILQSLSNCVPTVDELARIQGYKGEGAFSEAERFFQQVGLVPFLGSRYRILSLQCTLADTVSTLCERAQVVLAACRELLRSKTLAKALALILSVGNHLNHKPAMGFRLGSLCLVSRLKGDKINLLQHISTLEDMPSSRQLLAELPHVQAASAIKSDTFTIQAQELTDCISAATDGVVKDEKDEPHPEVVDALWESANRFKVYAAELLERVHKALASLNKATDEATCFFAEPGRPVEDLFEVSWQFCSELKQLEESMASPTPRSKFSPITPRGRPEPVSEDGSAAEEPPVLELPSPEPQESALIGSPEPQETVVLKGSLQLCTNESVGLWQLEQCVVTATELRIGAKLSWKLESIRYATLAPGNKLELVMENWQVVTLRNTWQPREMQKWRDATGAPEDPAEEPSPKASPDLKADADVDKKVRPIGKESTHDEAPRAIKLKSAGAAPTKPAGAEMDALPHRRTSTSRANNASQRPKEKRSVCPRGHGLFEFETNGGTCDHCEVWVPKDTLVLGCRRCNWWLCQDDWYTPPNESDNGAALAKLEQKEQSPRQMGDKVSPGDRSPQGRGGLEELRRVEIGARRGSNRNNPIREAETDSDGSESEGESTSHPCTEASDSTREAPDTITPLRLPQRDGSEFDEANEGAMTPSMTKFRRDFCTLCVSRFGPVRWRHRCQQCGRVACKVCLTLHKHQGMHLCPRCATSRVSDAAPSPEKSAEDEEAVRPKKAVLAPPVMHEAATCEVCKKAFSMMRRRHHCRQCGRSVCKQHATHEKTLPEFGYTAPVRVCDFCAED